MKKTSVSFLAVVIALVWCIPAFPRITEHAPGRPVYDSRAWPELGSLLNRPGRVYGYSYFSGNRFYYAGDTGEFNAFLEAYARLKGTPLTLVVHAGPGREKRWLESKNIRCDWKVDVALRRRPAERREGVTVAVWLGGQVELDKMKVPLTIKVNSGGEPGNSGDIEKYIAAHEAKRKVAGKTQTTSPSAGPDAGTEEGERAKPVPSTTRAESLVPATYRSKRPLYGKLALTEDGSRVLSMVLDESGGTRTGHDVLYADVNFNGTFEEAERLPAVEVKRHGTWLSTASFSPLNFDVPYNKKAEGIPNPCQVSLGYRQYPRAGVAEDFSVTMKIKLRQGPTVWDYSVTGSVKPSRRLDDAEVWTQPAPRMKLSTQPDKNKKGHLGIALDVSAGEGEFECRKAGLPVEAHVEIKKRDGEIVHRGDATPDKFRFG